MKKLVLVWLCALPLICFSQEVDELKNTILAEKTEYIEDVDLSKNELWLNLKTWISGTFNKYKGVVDLENEEAGRIILKSKVKVNSDQECLGHYGIMDAFFSFSLQVDCRDQKYRITIFDRSIDFSAKSTNSKGAPSKTLKLLISQGEDWVKKLAELDAGNSWSLSNEKLIPLLQKEYKMTQ